MQETEADLKRAALEFLEAAEAVAQGAAPTAADPLDAVSTDLFGLGDLEPVIGPGDLADLKDRLRRERLRPDTVLELVALARRVVGVLGGV